MKKRGILAFLCGFFLTQAFSVDYDILDLTGATLSEVLYYVNLGTPVYAYTGDDTAVLIVGYDASSITYFDPMNSTYSKMGLTEATTYFESFGNVFVSYLE